MMTNISTADRNRVRKQASSEHISVSVADAADRREIYRIRHEVYARELGQHPVNAAQDLHDPLDASNVYIVAKLSGAIAGFVSITPPGPHGFSIDKYFSRESLPFAVHDGLYEIRLLTVLKPHRGSDVAATLMYAAFRWVESRGGTHVAAIGRREIVELYLKAGLQLVGKSTQSGAVTYDLMHASVAEIRAAIMSYRGSLARLEGRVDWRLNFSFHKPAECFHGGAFFKAIGTKFETLEKRHDIINADVLDAWFPPSPLVTEKLTQHLDWLLRTSPPTDCGGLIESIAAARGVKPMNILPGGGSSDLIFRALRHWLAPESHALILDPTYGEYAHVLEKVVGCTVDRLALRRENDYAVDLDRLQSALADNYDLVVLVNPNSPTGRHIPRRELEPILRRAPANTRIWIDETYIEYVGAGESLETFVAQSENVIISKSMSKVYALSGARVAYLCARAHQLESLGAVTPPWVVSLPAQVAATYALRDPEYYTARYAETHRYREQLRHEFKARGWDVVPGGANYILAHVPESGPTARQLVEACQARGLFMRDAVLMGSNLGAHAIRIAVKDAATNRRLLEIIDAALIELRGGGSSAERGTRSAK